MDRCSHDAYAIISWVGDLWRAARSMIAGALRFDLLRFGIHLPQRPGLENRGVRASKWSRLPPHRAFVRPHEPRATRDAEANPANAWIAASDRVSARIALAHDVLRSFPARSKVAMARASASALAWSSLTRLRIPRSASCARWMWTA